MLTPLNEPVVGNASTCLSFRKQTEHLMGFELTGRHLSIVLASISLVYNVHFMYDPQTFPEYLNRHDFYTRGMVT